MACLLRLTWLLCKKLPPLTSYTCIDNLMLKWLHPSPGSAIPDTHWNLPTRNCGNTNQKLCEQWYALKSTNQKLWEHQPEIVATKSCGGGGGVTKPISSVPLCSQFSSLSKHTFAVKYRVYIWQVSPQLGPVLLTLLRHVARILANGRAAFFESCDAIGWNSCDVSQKR